MMILKFNITAIVLLLMFYELIIPIYASPLCGSSACLKIKCLPLERIRTECVAKKGILHEKSGWCDCCPNCIKRLYEDQNCSVTLSPQLPIRAKCSEGLICNTRTKKCVKSVVEKHN